jgi:energy-coupling factor transporter ATP-binding protein EcfA2
MPPDSTPVLRTLSPALRGLERGLRGWIDTPRRQPLSTLTRASLEGLANDLRRQADALDVDQPLLVILLLGGTGVGKSTLFNALAGGALAEASIQRPTTRDPVVYYHESIQPSRLDPLLRSCRLVPHDRPGLAHKVIVDTPDVDSTNLANRETLMRVMPSADVVLYVGSQEKYHDALVWEHLARQRKRRAFAFVLNKWDRCLHSGAEGLRPDEDLLRDLRDKGFASPLLFRTCAQHWVDRACGREAQPLPEGEQLPELAAWLEEGLTRLEVEAIKARGVSKLLAQVEQGVTEAAPPDLTEAAARTREAWKAPLREEARVTADLLVGALEPFQTEIEHHFALRGGKRFSGLMAGYLGLVARARFLGSSLQGRPEQPSAWDAGLFARACGDAAASRPLEARGKALADRLLVTGDGCGFPVALLAEPAEEAARAGWRTRWEKALVAALQDVEKSQIEPAGGRGAAQAIVLLLTHLLPPLTLIAGLGVFLWRYFDLMGTGRTVTSVYEVFLPFVATGVVLVLLHLVVLLVMPLRWSVLRQEYKLRLGERVLTDLEDVYLGLPEKVAQGLLEERKKAEALVREVHEVAAWLRKREESASISGLYGDG